MKVRKVDMNTLENKPLLAGSPNVPFSWDLESAIAMLSARPRPIALHPT